MANDLIPKDDDAPMAKMPIPEDERQALRIVGALDAARAGAAFMRGMTSALLLKICEQRLWRLDGFESQAAFLEAKHIDRRELADLKDELSVFGEALMTRLEEVGVSSKDRRKLTRVDKKDILELQVAIKKGVEGKELLDLAVAICEKAAETEIAKCQAVENYRNAKERLEEETAALKDTKKKLLAAETTIVDQNKFYGGNRQRGEMFRRALEALDQYQEHIRRKGVPTDDVVSFKRSIDLLRQNIDNIWLDFISPPKGAMSREDYKRILLKDKGMTEAEAETIASELWTEDNA